MQTLPEHFKTLLGRIEPCGKRLEAAQEIPAKVREHLEKSAVIQTVEPHSRLVGSYSRHTAIKDIKDVDVILFIKSTYRDEKPETVLDVLFSALQTLPESLEDTGEVTIRRKQRRSVNVHLEKRDFDLDIVPAVALAGLEKPLEIPDKDWSKWVQTHPLGYGDKLSKLNDQNCNRVVPLIKLFKHWRDFHMVYKRPKSYWLECMVYNSLVNKQVFTSDLSYAEIVRDMMGILYTNYAPYLDKPNKVPPVPDPMLGHNVAHNWERSHFEAFVVRLEESYKWAARALESEEDAVSVALWRKIFGDEWFPASDEVKGENLRAAALAGQIFVTSSGRVSSTSPAERSIQPPPQRFYGNK